MRENETRQRIKQELNENCRKMREEISDEFEAEDVDTLSNKLEQILKKSEEHLKGTAQVGGKPWMTREILKLMDSRREFKGKDNSKYKETHRLIKKKIIEAKENWMMERCDELEELQKRHDDRLIHRKIKEIAGIKNNRVSNALTSTENKILTTTEEVKKEWEKYIKDLFEDSRAENTTQNIMDENHLPILKSEIKYAIQNMKSGKAPGPDGVRADIMKLIEEDNLDLLTRIFNTIYKTDKIPREWLKSAFVPLPKTNNAKKCSDFRLISLMSHVLKLFLKIIHNRVYKRCEEGIGDEQFGFRSGLGTREALFGLVVLLQKCRDQQKNVYMCFIDYEKAFDRVDHKKLMECLQRKDLDPDDIRIIQNLYWNQDAFVRTQSGDTEAINIQKGVRQGCVLSPMLFNLYSEEIFTTALQNAKEGIKVNGKRVNNIRYADDTVLIAESEEDLQNLLDKIVYEGETYGIKVNEKKTKIMVVSKNNTPRANIAIGTHCIEQVENFKYLGCIMNDGLDPDKEIKSRIEQARHVFLKMRPFFISRNLSLALRYRMVRCYVYSVLLYGMEAWTLKVNTLRRLESFEMWIFRRMLRIPWTDHIRNEEVLRRMNMDRELLDIIKKRKTSYLGHLLRHERYNFLRIIMEGKIEGRRGPGRRQMTWLRNIKEWTGLDFQSLIRKAQSREEFAEVIANLR